MLLIDLFLTSFCCSSCFSPFCGSPWQPKLVLLHPSFISEKWNSKYWHVQDKFIYVISPLFSFWSEASFSFHSHLHSQWRDRHNAIVLMTEYRKLSSVITFASTRSNNEKHLKTWLVFHFKICFFLNVFHFRCAYLKTTLWWVFGFDVGLYGRWMLKLQPIVEVIVYMWRNCYIFHHIMIISSLYLESLGLNFQNRTCLCNCKFVCTWQESKRQKLTYCALSDWW